MSMRRIISICEAHHAHDALDHNTRFEPLRNGDTVRVFHGFYAMDEAVEAARTGLSGQERADRRYSYESDNNPKGLFVTLNVDVAKEFTSRGAIMEFTARWEDLEAPVWPGGGYTVQGQMAQYFGHGPNGRANRNAKRREQTTVALDSAKRNPDYMSHVPLSDDPHRAYILTQPREYQALYVGHLNPQDITAFWVSDDPKKDGKYTTWTRLAPSDFLEQNSKGKSKSDRFFLPNEEFSGDEFLSRMGKRYRLDLVEDMLHNAAEHIKTSKQPAYQFRTYFEQYLWPKQYVPAMRWLIKNYGKSKA